MLGRAYLTFGTRTVSSQPASERTAYSGHYAQSAATKLVDFIARIHALEKNQDLMNVERMGVLAGDFVLQDIRRVSDSLMIVDIDIRHQTTVSISSKRDLKISSFIVCLKAAIGFDEFPAFWEFVKRAGNRMEGC